MTTNKKITEYSAPASPAKLDAYLDQLATRLPTAGRLIFALDATAVEAADLGRSLQTHCRYVRGGGRRRQP